MPVWWKRSHCRVQFPLDIYADAKFNIMTIKERRIPDHHLRVCPDWTAANKSGQPKKGEHHKSGLEKAIAKANGAKKATAKKRRRCLVCGKFGHEIEACVALVKRECDESVQVDSIPFAVKIVCHSEMVSCVDMEEDIIEEDGKVALML